ncbi:MAG: hypothetical protein R3F11_14940 [Verrucomicrobiales bacterium]
MITVQTSGDLVTWTDRPATIAAGVALLDLPVPPRARASCFTG